jgi:hypothetical protein
LKTHGDPHERKDKKVLIDDDPDVLELLEYNLKGGYRVVTAPSS